MLLKGKAVSIHWVIVKNNKWGQRESETESTIEPLRVSFSIPLTRFGRSGHFLPNNLIYGFPIHDSFVF